MLSSVPEWQPDGVETKQLLAVDDSGKVTDLGEVPRFGVVGGQPLYHGVTSLESEPVEPLQRCLWSDQHKISALNYVRKEWRHG